jgi:hypothetical protein
MNKNKKIYYVKHEVKPDASDSSTRTILKNIKEKLYIYIPFRVNHFIFDNTTIRKMCGVFLIKEIYNPLAIVSDMTLVKNRSKSGFNKLTLTLSKNDDNNQIIIKRAVLVFSREYYTPELATKIANLKKVNFEKDIEWTIMAITGPKEQFKLKVAEPFDNNDSDIDNKK